MEGSNESLSPSSPEAVLERYLRGLEGAGEKRVEGYQAALLVVRDTERIQRLQKDLPTEGDSFEKTIAESELKARQGRVGETLLKYDANSGADVETITEFEGFLRGFTSYLDSGHTTEDLMDKIEETLA